MKDYRNVNDYNFTVHRITFTLTLCGEKVIETNMLEKMLTMFHASNLALAQQYWNCNFEEHFDLITYLLVAEQNNELFSKNHDCMPSSPVPEANYILSSKRKCGRGNWRKGNVNKVDIGGRPMGNQKPCANLNLNKGRNQRVRKPKTDRGGASLTGVCQ
ncbi:hypothetical protein GIB67_024648 [Kingdonia uniflora]|uniref:Uncharacterized protein n=1 Tax=Kingdonia uniflora TaxID=39325 RepID=A0A7J7LP29_9MAGN|nr:hypothetical protein GIB67_024648 [Kingdonia uniflora]